MVVLSFYSRMGGKFYLKKEIIKNFPDGYTTYVEPFCGACHVFFKKLPSEVEVLNDVDREIYNALNDVRQVNGEDVGRLEFPQCKDYFYAIKKSKPDTPLNRLHKFLYMKWTSFGGIMPSVRQGKHMVKGCLHS